MNLEKIADIWITKMTKLQCLSKKKSTHRSCARHEKSVLDNDWLRRTKGFNRVCVWPERRLHLAQSRHSVGLYIQHCNDQTWLNHIYMWGTWRS